MLEFNKDELLLIQATVIYEQITNKNLDISKLCNSVLRKVKIELDIQNKMNRRDF